MKFILSKDEIGACGIGQPRCCVYLTMGYEGMLCGREEPELRATIDSIFESGTMNATRRPALAYPECQSDG